ncbi:phosphate ABC transporter substrate-binding protein, PhoT family (TC 3.A.1.7.1) [Amphibacillus marinus]|uniref:Phosphate-binding protein n=1 Tax=Amphibacillus marinus TaxID=872970 RepID=A0A1H8PMP2_9BACI|nr:phosphate ABC transporter substrate-binding protein [Amphibacillus marinus]SEO42987.1 phosphate ABC transporter substrate-binding protein, PhoT family (TC 3.A.1.7.1) [Amphibacillus marinus]
MKKFLMLVLISMFAVTLLAACGQDTDEEVNGDDPVEEEVEDNGAAEEEPEADGLEGTITMAGSTSVQPLSEELAAAFMSIHPDARLEVSGGGSGAGITAAQDNAADLGAVSREVADDETGIDVHTIAIDGIAIIVHPDNPVADLSIEQIQAIFSGGIVNWSEVGGDDEDIVVVSREEGSGTRGAFEDIVMGEEELVATAIIQNSGGSLRESVAADPNGIGYVSLGGLNDTVKGLQVDSVDPTAENVLAGDYTVSRPFNYVSNDSEPLSELAQAFLDFVLSGEGQNVVEEQGFIKVN